MRTRNWCVTSWTCPDYDSVERLVVSGEYKYVCVGKETCPRTGKVHWHWYLQAVNKKSMRQIKKDVGDRMAHAEAANGPADAGIAYVKKDGEWKEWGEPKKQGRRSDLEDCKRIIDNSVDDAMGTMQQIADAHFGDFIWSISKGLNNVSRICQKLLCTLDGLDQARATIATTMKDISEVDIGTLYRWNPRPTSTATTERRPSGSTSSADESCPSQSSLRLWTNGEAEWRPREDLDRSSQNDFLSPLWSGLPNGGLDLADLTLTPTNCIEESPRYFGAEDLDKNPWS